MAKKFTEIEKENIKNKIISNCKDSWSNVGYKKTSVDELCKKSGISKGAFYLFYSSKEDLFFEILIDVQKNLKKIMINSLNINSTKEDLSKMLKLVYREYSKNNFIAETNNPDFISLMNKVPKDKLDEVDYRGKNNLREEIKKTNLKFKIEEDKGLAVIGVLFSMVLDKNEMIFDHLEVFDFMIDNLINDIFE